MEKIQEIELTIKNATDGVFAVSLVDQPAIEEDFVYLEAHEVEFKVVDEERRVVVGFALIPEKRILRMMGGKKFNIFFTAETVAQTAEGFMKGMKLNKFTTDHEDKVDGISVIESWIVEDAKNDKSNIYGLGAKGGEWVLMSKIDNDEVWAEVKAGKFKGYSIEARFDGFEQLQKKETMEEKIIAELITALSSDEVKLNVSDAAIKSLKQFMSGQLQSTNDLYDTLLTTVKDYNKKVDTATKKFSEIESNDYVKAYTKITDMANELGIAPADVPGLKELDRLYFYLKEKVGDLKKINP